MNKMTEMDIRLHEQGSSFEVTIKNILKNKNPEFKYGFFSPDWIDTDNKIAFECKCTRPYYNTPQQLIGTDIGTGMRMFQYLNYKKLIKHGFRVFMIHGMTKGAFMGNIFHTEITPLIIKKQLVSDNKKTVYWLYNDLKIADYNSEINLEEFYKE